LRGDGFEELKQLLHCPALPDDAFEPVPLFELCAQIRVLGFQAALFERRLEDVQELVNLEWLADEVVRPALDCAHGVLRRPIAGDDDGDDFRITADSGLY
jgi:hypothetical protein